MLLGKISDFCLFLYLKVFKPITYLPGSLCGDGTSCLADRPRYFLLLACLPAFPPWHIQN